MVVPDTAIAAAITGTTLANLGVAAHGRGELDLASTRHEQALQVCRERGYTLGAIRSLRDLGDVERDRGDYVQSVSRYREAMELLDDQPDLRVVADALEGTALAAATWRRLAHAARLLGAAEKFRTQHGGEFLVPADRLAHERAVVLVRSGLSEPDIDAAWADGRQLTVTEAIGEIQALAPPADPAQPAIPPTTILTPREHEVLQMLVAGLSDRAIADALFLSVRTVEAHVAKILDKLDVRTRTAAVSTAIATGLVDLAQGVDQPRD
jgi:non-specific serine/threonine protein kinase